MHYHVYRRLGKQRGVVRGHEHRDAPAFHGHENVASPESRFGWARTRETAEARARAYREFIAALEAAKTRHAHTPQRR